VINFFPEPARWENPVTVQYDTSALPLIAGIGFRAPHMREVVERRPSAGWLEVFAENYMNRGIASSSLEKIRANYPLSIYGVGLSLCSANGIDLTHLDHLKDVCRHFEPCMVSEYLSWSVGEGIYLNDLLPIRYDDEALDIVAGNISRLQDALKRSILIENLANYVGFAQSTMTEPEFLAILVRRTGCGLLLDINNVFVSAQNMGFDPNVYISGLPASAIGDIRLAGHIENQMLDGPVLIDNNGSRIAHEVWSLYASTVERMGRRPTLIEWDSDLPTIDILLGEAMWADLLAGATVFNQTNHLKAPGKRRSRANRTFDTAPVPKDHRQKMNRSFREEHHV
jgi:uncharacterized protein